jgi:hypothetical protein
MINWKRNRYLASVRRRNLMTKLQKPNVAKRQYNMENWEGFISIWSRGGSVSKVSGYGLNDRVIEVLSQA